MHVQTVHITMHECVTVLHCIASCYTMHKKLLCFCLDVSLLLLSNRWYGLQIAREGDVYAVQRFLNRVPDYPDKDNMFRAAVRFRVSQ
jgi:hypothetical protein